MALYSKVIIFATSLATLSAGFYGVKMWVKRMNDSLEQKLKEKGKDLSLLQQKNKNNLESMNISGQLRTENESSTSTNNQVSPKVSKPEESTNSTKLFFKPNLGSNRLTPNFQQPSYSLPKFQIL